ncbi:hypothetical protein [Mesorhizobium sp.]|uniref:hypothetical protein n=1 Tax=Mesorhizobium sp. TaxID=1871066 RepID=UPI000FE4B587|nr:hypothetical protein [Mesorhizobium sp.]RWC38330.1 MAG: hypothetical protein EOS28_30260 [Mesorhizobium sp.]RWF04512.1 MAG: hypothetical protein EOS68_02600 [Mesorhizobium sp.]
MEGESAPKGSGKVRLKTLDDPDRRTTAARVVFGLERRALKDITPSLRDYVAGNYAGAAK